MGNTRPMIQVCCDIPVHPHACGEHARGLLRFRLCFAGSSPRLWGTHLRALPQNTVHRFIPTPVGNTSPVHPSWLLVSGSSPRRRGTLSRPFSGRHVMRFIPTPVGNTAGLRPEYQSRGSSPRLWGTHVLHGGLAIDVRFIPTPVGNTFGHDQNIGLVAVHPHACGEHTSSIPLISCSVFKEQNATKKSAPLFKFSSPSDSLLLVRTKPA